MLVSDACWTLGYLSDDSTADGDHIQAIIDSGVVPELVTLMSHQSPLVQQAALRVCANAVTSLDSQTQFMIDVGLVAALKPLLTSLSKKMHHQVLWCLSNITAGGTDQIQCVIDAGILPTVVQVLKHDITVRRTASPSTAPRPPASKMRASCLACVGVGVPSDVNVKPRG